MHAEVTPRGGNHEVYGLSDKEITVVVEPPAEETAESRKCPGACREDSGISVI